MTAAQLAGFIIDCVQEALKVAARTSHGLTVNLFADDHAGFSHLRAWPHGELVLVSVHGPYMSVTAWMPVEVTP